MFMKVLLVGLNVPSNLAFNSCCFRISRRSETVSLIGVSSFQARIKMGTHYVSPFDSSIVLLGYPLEFNPLRRTEEDAVRSMGHESISQLSCVVAYH